MPTERIRRASEMAVVCVRPCVGLCEWDPRVGRSLIPQGAHCLARSGVSRWLEGWAGDKPKVFNQNDPPGIPHWLVTPQWRGWARWPLSLWSSLICVHCAMDSVSISHIYTIWITVGSYSKLRVQTQYWTLWIQPKLKVVQMTRDFSVISRYVQQ